MADRDAVAAPEPVLHVHRSFPTGYVVEVQPLPADRFGFAVFVSYPSLLSHVIFTSRRGFIERGEVLPALDELRVIQAALIRWTVWRNHGGKP